jgi:hypothetical protein
VRAVDTGEAGEFDGDAGLLGDFSDHRGGGGLADLDAASGQLPVAVVDAADEQQLACPVADRGERGG